MDNETVTVEDLEQTIETLQASLSETAAELAAAKKAYRDRKTTHLRELYEARKETEAAIREEIRALGMTPRTVMPSLSAASFRF